MFQNKYAAAASQLQELIKAHPQDAMDHATYALVLNYETKEKPALDEALKAQKIAPHDGFVLTVLTRVEDWNDDIQSAARDGAAAIKAAPNSALARAFYGEALADVERLLELARFSIGRQDLSAATQFLERAASLSPDDAGLREQLGDVALFAQDYKVAKSAYEAALKLQPRSALDLKVLGDIAVALD